MPAKLHFFRDEAQMLVEFLTGFQEGSPTKPFLNDSSEVIIHHIMKIIILNNVLKEAVTADLLIKIRMSKTSDQLTLDDMKLSTTTEILLKVVSATFLLVCFLSHNNSTCQTRKNAFYFISKALFVLETIKF